MRILVPPEHLDQVAEEFRQAGESTKKLVSQLSQAMNHLEMGWSGTTRTNFFAMYQETHHHLNSASESMLSTHHELTGIAQRFRIADQEGNKTPIQETTHTIPNSSHPVGPFQARFGMDPAELGPPAPWVKNTLNFFFGTSDMANETNTLHSDASTGTKIVAGAGLLGNILLDASYAFGAGEVIKGTQFVFKGGKWLLRAGIHLPKIVVRGGTVLKVVKSTENLTDVDRILQEMRKYKAEMIEPGNPVIQDSSGITKGTVEAGGITEQFADEIGEYGDVGGHHVHAKAAFKNIVQYDPKKGFSISQKFMKLIGWDHTDITNAQRKLFKELAESGRPNTLAEQSRIAEEALIQAGASPADAKTLVELSLDNLKQQGVTVPSNIPWFK